MLYTVSEVAKILHVAPSTLRYYDREGLLPFVGRSSGGIRVFTETDLRWLKMISCLKCAGMPIKSIRRYVESAMRGDETLKERLEMIYEQRRGLLAQMEELRRTLDVVEYKCWYYETALEAGTEAHMNTLPPEAIPPRFREVVRQLHGEMEEMDDSIKNDAQSVTD